MRPGAFLLLAALSATISAAPLRAPGASRAAQTAALLVAAERRATSPRLADRAAVRDAVDRLERIGARPAEDEADDVVGIWRSAIDAPAPNWRGRVLGPAFRRGWLAPGATWRIDQLFLAGQPATVAVAAGNGQPVRLAIHGPDEKPVCAPGRADCTWHPVFTQRYAIAVHNPGARPASFYLVTD